MDGADCDGVRRAITEGAGPGAWTTAVSASLMFVVFLVALVRGEKDITRSDWISLVGVAIAGLIWALSDGPLISVFLLVAIYLFAFIPTFRKSYARPGEETLSLYWIASLRLGVAITALDRFAVTTVLYPAVVMLGNASFVAMTVRRRRELAANGV